MFKNIPKKQTPPQVKFTIAKKIIDILKSSTLIFDFEDLLVPDDHADSPPNFLGDTYNGYITIHQNFEAPKRWKAHGMKDCEIMEQIKVIKELDALYPGVKVCEVMNERITIYILNMDCNKWFKQLKEAINND